MLGGVVVHFMHVVGIATSRHAWVRCGACTRGVGVVGNIDDLDSDSVNGC